MTIWEVMAYGLMAGWLIIGVTFIGLAIISLMFYDVLPWLRKKYPTLRETKEINDDE